MEEDIELFRDVMKNLKNHFYYDLDLLPNLIKGSNDEIREDPTHAQLMVGIFLNNVKSEKVRYDFFDFWYHYGYNRLWTVIPFEDRTEWMRNYKTTTSHKLDYFIKTYNLDF